MRIATLDWAPYVGPALPGHGWLADLVRRAFDRHGHDVEYAFLPWQRALGETLDGRHDAVMPMYVTPLRRHEYVLSAPLPAGAYGFYARRGEDTGWDGQLSSVHGRVLGSVQGYALPPGISPRTFRIDLARNDLLNLRKLVEGRIDLAIIDHVVARYLLADHVELGAAVVELAPSFGLRATALGLSTQHPDAEQLVGLLDTGLREIVDDGTAAQVLDVWGLRDAITLSGGEW
ncbi:MAG: transporter substrate-binding domain-containing protein [Alphaproteobacteria bacterium]|nr:transporter substrate-binding domain-containing protein [Alphaproteobacteria bacterium]